MIRILVIGSKLEALITAWVLRQHPQFDVRLVTDEPIAEYAPDPRMMIHTESFGNVLRELDVMYSSFTPNEGILLRGKIEEFPRDLTGMPKPDANKVMEDLRRKTGEDFQLGSSFRRRHHRRIRLDGGELAVALLEKVKLLVAPNWTLEPGVLKVNGSQRFEYDFVVYSIPLWIRKRVWFSLPDVAMDAKRFVLLAPRKLSPFRRWDTVLAPYTPEDVAYRVHNLGGGCSVEMRGAIPQATMLSELNFLFPDGYSLLRIYEGQVMRPLPDRISWPENVVPVGAFTEWRPEVSIEDAVDLAYSLMRRWSR